MAPKTPQGPKPALHTLSQLHEPLFSAGIFYLFGPRLCSLSSTTSASSSRKRSQPNDAVSRPSARLLFRVKAGLPYLQDTRTGFLHASLSSWVESWSGVPASSLGPQMSHYCFFLAVDQPKQAVFVPLAEILLARKVTNRTAHRLTKAVQWAQQLVALCNGSPDVPTLKPMDDTLFPAGLTPEQESTLALQELPIPPPVSLNPNPNPNANANLNIDSNAHVNSELQTAVQQNGDALTMLVQRYASLQPVDCVRTAVGYDVSGGRHGSTARAKASNEDRPLVRQLTVQGQPVGMILAVADGHGGARCAEFVTTRLPSLLEREIQDHLDDWLTVESHLSSPSSSSPSHSSSATATATATTSTTATTDSLAASASPESLSDTTPLSTTSSVNGFVGRPLYSYQLYHVPSAAHDDSSSPEYTAARQRIRARLVEMCASLDEAYLAQQRSICEALVSKDALPAMLEGRLELKNGKTRYYDDGCTLSCTIVVGHAAVVMNVGDSRSIVFRSHSSSPPSASAASGSEPSPSSSSSSSSLSSSTSASSHSSYSNPSGFDVPRLWYMSPDHYWGHPLCFERAYIHKAQFITHSTAQKKNPSDKYYDDVLAQFQAPVRLEDIPEALLLAGRKEKYSFRDCGVNVGTKDAEYVAAVDSMCLDGSKRLSVARAFGDLLYKCVPARKIVVSEPQIDFVPLFFDSRRKNGESQKEHENDDEEAKRIAKKKEQEAAEEAKRTAVAPTIPLDGQLPFTLMEDDAPFEYGVDKWKKPRAKSSKARKQAEAASKEEPNAEEVTVVVASDGLWAFLQTQADKGQSKAAEQEAELLQRKMGEMGLLPPDPFARKKFTAGASSVVDVDGCVEESGDAKMEGDEVRAPSRLDRESRQSAVVRFADWVVSRDYNRHLKRFDDVSVAVGHFCRRNQPAS